VIPSVEYFTSLDTEKEITVTEGDQQDKKMVKCEIDYFTSGASSLVLGANFFSDFQLVANNADATNTLSFKTDSKVSNGAGIRESGAFAALSASALALASTLLF